MSQQTTPGPRKRGGSASGGTSDVDSEDDVAGVSTWSVLRGKTNDLIEKINAEPDALDAYASQTALTAYLLSAKQLRQKFKPDGYGEDAAWQKEPGKTHCNLCIKRWRLPEQAKGYRAGTHCHECHSHDKHLTGCVTGAAATARATQAAETKMFGERATVNQYHVVATKTGTDMPLNWISVIVDICREHGIEYHFAPERGDQDGNLHGHLVIKIRCNLADQRDFLAHCKQRCGIIGTGQGTKWSIQHLPARKGNAIASLVKSLVKKILRLLGGSDNRRWHSRTVLACRADWLQALRCISKQAKTAHFKDAQHGAKSSTTTQGDWEQLCTECGWQQETESACHTHHVTSC